MIPATLKANTQELLNAFPTGERESSLYLAALSCEYFSSPSAEYLFLCRIIFFIQNVKNDSIEKKLSIGRAFFLFSLSNDLASCCCAQVLSIHLFCFWLTGILPSLSLKEWARAGRGTVLETGIRHSLRSGHLNKPVFFYTSKK